MNNEKFDIFVSYAHEDKRFVGEVIQKLSSSGLSVWIDKEIHHGESISSRIVKAIDKARFVLFFSSKNSNASDYCIGEILVAVQKKKCIIPIKIDSTEYCDDLLVHLIRLHYVNFINGFSREEYNELVTVLSGGFTTNIPEIGIQSSNNFDEQQKQKKVKWLIVILFTISITLLCCVIVLLVKPTDESTMTTDPKITIEINKKPIESDTKKINLNEHKELATNLGIEANKNSKIKTITVVVKKGLDKIFEKDIKKFKETGVSIESDSEHETEDVTFICTGNPEIIDKIIYKANKGKHRVIPMD